MGRRFDIAIVGGGLAGGLAALAIRRAHPSLSLALFEAGDSFGGNHRWSWFESDLSQQGEALLAPFARTEWTGGNEVRFPAHRRVLTANYRSLDSRDFDRTLRRELPQEAQQLGSRVERLDASGIELATGERVEARTVIDCRDAGPSKHLTGGWQVFLGQHLRTASPHGIDRPVIMDATVRQHGAYRFVDLLPMGPDEIFVEDTYYADSAALDAPALRERIAAYAADKGWEATVLQEETGVLPVITGGDFAAYRASLEEPEVVLAGARGGFVHPLTSYTIPVAVENALAIADAAAFPRDELARLVDRRGDEVERGARREHRIGRWSSDRIRRPYGGREDLHRPEDCRALRRAFRGCGYRDRGGCRDDGV